MLYVSNRPLGRREQKVFGRFNLSIQRIYVETTLHIQQHVATEADVYVVNDDCHLWDCLVIAKYYNFTL